MTRPRTVGYWLEESVELVDRDAPQYATFAQAFPARRVGAGNGTKVPVLRAIGKCQGLGM
jgi:hypothetical protein